MKKNLWAAWVPDSYSWLKAFMLALSMTVFLDLGRIAGTIGYLSVEFADMPEAIAIAGILALLSPILAIAVIHHLFSWGFSRVKNQPAQSGVRKHLFPGLQSWWQGMYAWLVIILSTLITTALCTLLMPLFNLNYEKIMQGSNRWGEIELLAWLAVIWIGTAAGLYQFESSLKLHRHSGADVSSDFQNLASPFDSDLLKVPIQPDRNSNLNQKKKAKVIFKLEKPSRQVDKLIIPLIIVLAASGVYGFAKWSELEFQNAAPLAIPKKVVTPPAIAQSQNTAIAASVTSEKLLPVPYAPPADKPADTQASKLVQSPPPSTQLDPFQQAVNKATSAANLTQLAKSRVEWEAIARQWQDAIALMKAVPESNPHYALAQLKAIEYQENLNYALKAAATRPQ